MPHSRQTHYTRKRSCRNVVREVQCERGERGVFKPMCTLRFPANSTTVPDTHLRAHTKASARFQDSTLEMTFTTEGVRRRAFTLCSQSRWFWSTMDSLCRCRATALALRLDFSTVLGSAECSYSHFWQEGAVAHHLLLAPAAPAHSFCHRTASPPAPEEGPCPSRSM